MSYQTDPRVDAYIDALPEWQQAISRRVREADNRAGGWRKLKRDRAAS